MRAVVHQPARHSHIYSGACKCLDRRQRPAPVSALRRTGADLDYERLSHQCSCVHVRTSCRHYVDVVVVIGKSAHETVAGFGPLGLMGVDEVAGYGDSLPLGRAA